ncbi:hypothetical protein H0V99_01915 [Candidatus Saccharibacteria bacterium]|nr:hypothetical protein [Candidatus Saccharibacteria bacterium]
MREALLEQTSNNEAVANGDIGVVAAIYKYLKNVPDRNVFSAGEVTDMLLDMLNEATGPTLEAESQDQLVSVS